MDTALNLPAPATLAASPGPVLERAITTKVTPVDASNNSTTRPAEKPFVAQVVSARLSGAEYPENPGEIAPPDRTLRPYDVPMLPYEGAEEAASVQAESTAQTELTSQEEQSEADL